MPPLQGIGHSKEQSAIVSTKHLLRYITTPGLSLAEMFKRVRYAVIQETEGKQVPWEAFSLPQDFSLGRKPE